MLRNRVGELHASERDLVPPPEFSPHRAIRFPHPTEVIVPPEIRPVLGADLRNGLEIQRLAIDQRPVQIPEDAGKRAVAGAKVHRPMFAVKFFFYPISQPPLRRWSACRAGRRVEVGGGKTFRIKRNITSARRTIGHYYCAIYDHTLSLVVTAASIADLIAA